MPINSIHWFPGHMAKALREVEAKVKYIDVIIELLDARAPNSSLNPYLNKISPQKPRLIILAKKDLADEKKAQKWLRFYQTQGYRVLMSNLQDRTSKKDILNALQPLYEAKMVKSAKRGLKPQPLRALIVGIPNVGKSTLINLLVGHKSAKAANKPGLTRGQQWVKVGSQLELIDTPGILPANYENQLVALRLSMIGTIPETILPNDRIQTAIIDFLVKTYPQYLIDRYDLKQQQLISHEDILSGIAERRGLLISGELNLIEAGNLLQKEFRSGILGPLVLDEIEDA